MTPRALHVVTDTRRRGAQVFAESVAHRLKADHVRVRTVALAPGTPGSRIDADVLGPSRLSPRTLVRLRAALEPVDVAVGFGSSTLPALTAARVGTGVPFVYRSIGESGYWVNTAARRVRVKAMLRRADGIVALWHGAADDLVCRYGLRPERIHVIPRGVAASTFPARSSQDRLDGRARMGVEPDRAVACMVGSLSAEKNVDLAIDVVAALPDVVLLLAGSGPDEPRLRRKAAAVAPGRVRFLGALDDVQPVYHASDILLLTSASEGMPGVVIEAGMTGLPAVATAVGAVPEMIADGATGYVVARDVSPSELRERVQLALDRGPGLGAAMQRHCLENYEIGVVASSWRSMLNVVAD